MKADNRKWIFCSFGAVVLLKVSGKSGYILVLWRCSVNAETMGSNPVKVPKKFWGVLFAIAEIAITTASIISSFKSGVGIVQCRGGSRIFLSGGAPLQNGLTDW